MGASGVAVATTFGIQICLAIVVFLLFSRLRLAGFARRFYAPKLFDSTVPPEKKPRRLPPGLFSWMGVVFNYPETDLIKSAGLDAAIYLRVLSFGWEVFVKVSLITCIIILPINLSGDRVDQLLAEQAAEEAANNPSPAPARLLLHTATRLARHLLQAAAETSPPLSPSPSPSPNSVEVKKYSFTTFDKCSLANLPPSSHKFWAHMVAVYVVTYFVLTALSRFNAQATLLRLAYLANAPRGGPSHTVLVTDIPGMRYGTLVWYLRGLAGSTLFVLLPAKWKKKVLDTVESGFQVVEAITSADVGAQLRRDKARNAAAAAEKPVPLEITAMAKAAEANTREAEEVEASKQKKASGVIRARRRKPGSEILAADESLDPWFQAKEALGDANDPSPELVEKFVQDEIEGTYGKHCVAAVNPVWDQRELNPLLGEYAAIRQQLEDYLDLCASKLKRKQPIKKRQKVTVLGPRMGSWGIREYGMKAQKVDAIEFWTKRLRYLAQEIPRAQQRGLDRAIPACFVTVNSRATQVTMSTTLHHHDETTWQIQGAPEPKEVIWGSLPMRRWERSLRTVALWAVYVVLLCFYMIPITAMQGLINVPKLATVPVLGDIVNLPVIKQLLEGIVPGLVLVIFLAVLPAILALFCRLSGFVSTSQVDFGVTTRYFYFQVVALFLGSLVAGSLFNQLQQFVQQPTSLITILGSAIPGTAAFFINYILVAGIGRSGINHLRIVGLIILWLKAKAAATKRARDRVWSDQTILYGPNVPNFTIYFLLGLVYCCVNPIISPTVLLFYSFAIISERYNLLYVYKSEYESGGRLWYYVFNQFMIGMYFFQIFMLVLLLLKKFVWAVLLIPAPIITLAYHIANLKLHGRPWRVMSAHDAAMLDRMDQEEQGTDEVTPAEKKLIQEMYLSPAFNFPSDEVQKLLQEAEVVSNAIDGKGTTKDIEADDDFQNAQEMWGEEAGEEARPSQASTSTNGDVALKNLKLDSGPLAGGQASGSGASSLVDPTDVKPRIKRG